MQKRSPIHHSVGVSAANLPSDVATVQHLLNASGASTVTVDGRIGPLTIAAIEKIQRRYLHMQKPDGRVDPNGETIHFLAAAHTPAVVSHPTPSQSFTSSFSQTLTSAVQSFESTVSHLISQYVTPHTTTVAAQSHTTPPAQTVAPPPSTQIAWGGKVPPAFKAKVIEICKDLEINPDFLMSCMAFESGESFSASKRSPVSSATGLIQFMHSTAISLGTTTAALAKMTEVEQLDYVKKYFMHYKGKIKTIEDIYMVILWPAAVGKDNSYVLFSKPSKSYTANAPLDADKDGHITKAEAAAQPAKKLIKGRLPNNIG
jgi:hypothetical protein